MGGRATSVVAVLVATGLVIAGCSDAADSGGDATLEGVDFAELDAVFEAVPPGGGGGDRWVAFRDDFTAPESTLRDFERGGKSGTRTDGAYELVVPDADDFAAVTTKAIRSNRVTVQASVGSTGTATDAGYGVVCRRDDAGSFFYGAVGHDGTYAIGRVDDDETTVLSGDGDWVDSATLFPDQASYSVRLTCDRDVTTGPAGPIVLTLTVDGRTVDSVTTGDTGGRDAGIFLETFNEPDAAAMFSEFLVATGGTVVSDETAGAPDSSHDFKVLALNQPTTGGPCERVSAGHFRTRVPADFVARCSSTSYLPGSRSTFFAYTGRTGDPETPVQRARATYRDLLRRIGLEPEHARALPDCGDSGVHQGRLAGVATGDPSSSGAVACGEAQDGRTFVVSYLGGDRGVAVAAIAIVPEDQRDEFADEWSRDFPGLPNGADAIAFDTQL